MKLIVDIPDEIYKKYMDDRTHVTDVLHAVRNGTQLPEHHGDLVDRDAIEVLRIGNIKREYDKGFDAGVSCMVNRIHETPTIIEGSDSE
jgi:hypothetical protein